jgi:hypothetical protein
VHSATQQDIAVVRPVLEESLPEMGMAIRSRSTQLCQEGSTEVLDFRKEWRPASCSFQQGSHDNAVMLCIRVPLDRPC